MPGGGGELVIGSLVTRERPRPAVGRSSPDRCSPGPGTSRAHRPRPAPDSRVLSRREVAGPRPEATPMLIAESAQHLAPGARELRSSAPAWPRWATNPSRVPRPPPSRSLEQNIAVTRRVCTPARLEAQHGPGRVSDSRAARRTGRPAATPDVKQRSYWSSCCFHFFINDSRCPARCPGTRPQREVNSSQPDLPRRAHLPQHTTR